MTINPPSKDPVRSLEILLPEIKENLKRADYDLAQAVLEYARKGDLENNTKIYPIYQVLQRIQESSSHFYRYTKNYNALGTTISLIREIMVMAYIVPESEEKQSHL